MPTSRPSIAAAASLIVASMPVLAQPCASVEVHNVRPQQGHLMVAAYADASSYGKTPLTRLRLPAGESSTQRFEVCGLVGVAVALTLFQDLDSDGKMARNPLGVPLEPWGASGRPGMLGPNWDDTRVPLDGQPIAVRLSQ